MDISIRQFYNICLILSMFENMYVFIVSVYICIFLLFSWRSLFTLPIWNTSFPVDSTDHAFMFNLTPCYIMNRSVWTTYLTWIPSESLLTRQYILTMQKKRTQAKSWHFILNPKWRSVSVIKNGIDTFLWWTEMMICGNKRVWVLFAGAVTGALRADCTVHANLRLLGARPFVWKKQTRFAADKICSTQALLAWRRPKSFYGERIPLGCLSMAGLLPRVCMLQKLEMWISCGAEWTLLSLLKKLKQILKLLTQIFYKTNVFDSKSAFCFSGSDSFQYMYFCYFWGESLKNIVFWRKLLFI